MDTIPFLAVPSLIARLVKQDAGYLEKRAAARGRAHVPQVVVEFADSPVRPFGAEAFINGAHSTNKNIRPGGYH
jgi:hypothetical protein